MSQKNKVLYDRRVGNLVERAGDARVIFPHWKGEKECWMFLSAHDDDIVIGAGLTLLAGLQEGIKTHAVISANGNMGYCRPEQRETIADVRKKETVESFELLGLSKENVHFLDFDDCSFYRNAGRRFAGQGETGPVIEGATGLQNSYTWILRKVRPTRVFLPNMADIHPDHQLTAKEMLISIFHAQGGIWPELGPSLEEIPQLYEYSAYSDFITPPTMRIRTCDELLEKKLAGISAFKSQEQIEMVIDVQRKSGPQEYLREVKFDIMEPHKHDILFG
ncbi:MAG: PIG-L deacetylase family protein [Planctomycetia bacterium]|nr:PIG-L deacetylase family protein [Planctomycetia bacterium]